MSQTRTTITVYQSTKDELDKLGRKNESYDELIRRLIRLAMGSEEKKAFGD